MIENRVVPECYVDSKVAEILGQTSNKYNHQHGCGNVSNKLKKDLADQVALGIIDEDKNKGPAAEYFSEFITLKEDNNLILKKHKSRRQYLIIVCPEIEKWLLADAEKVNIYR